jgi:hypothetical protein
MPQLSRKTKNLPIMFISAKSLPEMNLKHKNNQTISLFVMMMNNIVMVKKDHRKMIIKSMRVIGPIMTISLILSH